MPSLLLHGNMTLGLPRMSRTYKRAREYNEAQTDLDCIGPDCDRKPIARGMCRTHYDQNRRGKELAPIRKYKNAS